MYQKLDSFIKCRVSRIHSLIKRLYIHSTGLFLHLGQAGGRTGEFCFDCHHIYLV